MLLVRRARPADAAALSDLAMRSKAVWGYDAAFMEACREELATTKEAIRANEIWIAERDQDLAGFYELIPDTLRRHGEVRMCFVDPAFLRQGIASVLWRHLELRAHVRGCFPTWPRCRSECCALLQCGRTEDCRRVTFGNHSRAVFAAYGKAVIGVKMKGGILRPSPLSAPLNGTPKRPISSSAPAWPVPMWPRNRPRHRRSSCPLPRPPAA